MTNLQDKKKAQKKDKKKNKEKHVPDSLLKTIEKANKAMTVTLSPDKKTPASKNKKATQAPEKKPKTTPSPFGKDKEKLLNSLREVAGKIPHLQSLAEDKLGKAKIPNAQSASPDKPSQSPNAQSGMTGLDLAKKLTDLQADLTSKALDIQAKSVDVQAKQAKAQADTQIAQAKANAAQAQSQAQAQALSAQYGTPIGPTPSGEPISPPMQGPPVSGLTGGLPPGQDFGADPNLVASMLQSGIPATGMVVPTQAEGDLFSILERLRNNPVNERGRILSSKALKSLIKDLERADEKTLANAYGGLLGQLGGGLLNLISLPFGGSLGTDLLGGKRGLPKDFRAKLAAAQVGGNFAGQAIDLAKAEVSGRRMFRTTITNSTLGSMQLSGMPSDQKDSMVSFIANLSDYAMSQLPFAAADSGDSYIAQDLSPTRTESGVLIQGWLKEGFDKFLELVNSGGKNKKVEGTIESILEQWVVEQDMSKERAEARIDSAANFMASHLRRTIFPMGEGLDNIPKTGPQAKIFEARQQSYRQTQRLIASYQAYLKDRLKGIFDKLNKRSQSRAKRLSDFEREKIKSFVKSPNTRYQIPAPF